MTELKNLPATCAFGQLYDSLLLYKVVDQIKSDKIKDFLLKKGVCWRKQLC